MSTTTQLTELDNYAKTLPLSFDQVKALGMQKGTNTIAVLLAATGGVVCTAKIFIWEETDRAVVSNVWDDYEECLSWQFPCTSCQINTQ